MASVSITYTAVMYTGPAYHHSNYRPLTLHSLFLSTDNTIRQCVNLLTHLLNSVTRIEVMLVAGLKWSEPETPKDSRLLDKISSLYTRNHGYTETMFCLVTRYPYTAQHNSILSPFLS